MSLPSNSLVLQAAVEQALGRAFGDEPLLQEALTHSSFHEGRGGVSNERLEFLGDRVLGLIVAEQLYRRFPHWGEDELAPRLNSVVNRQACAGAARSAGVGPALRLSPAEAEQGGRDKQGILADASEALVAAIYLEGGLAAARAFVEAHWAHELSSVASAARDAKMALQEFAAAKKLSPPHYSVSARAGPDHAPLFTICVEVAGLGRAEAQAGSKREAERAAAARLLDQVGIR